MVYATNQRVESFRTFSLVCPESDILNGNIGKISKYTAYDTDNGNGLLNGYKIGLLTVDEVVGAGSNIYDFVYNSYYLIQNTENSNYWWTMSPSHIDGSGSALYGVMKNGKIGPLSANNSSQFVRPSIALSSNIEILSGVGTISNPFIILSDN